MGTKKITVVTEELVEDTILQDDFDDAEHASEVVESVAKQPADLVEFVQVSLNDFKIEVKHHVEKIVARIPLNANAFLALKDTLSSEFFHLWEDLAQTSKTFKEEVMEISLKHKSHLIEEFNRSKEQTLGAFHKMSDTTHPKT